jgi:hypothetical protein
MISINSNETLIQGAWVVEGGQVVGDAAVDRINELIATELRQIATSPDGWTVLYVDPRDGRHWELSYPLGEMHGAGPPTLAYVSEREATQRYPIPDRDLQS